MRLDINQHNALSSLFPEKKFEKVLVVRKKVVPLHPLNEKRLSGTPREALRTEFFERFT